jgi:hypothetical protein
MNGRPPARRFYRRAIVRSAHQRGPPLIVSSPSWVCAEPPRYVDRVSVDPQAEAERLRQSERRRWFEERCGREPWFSVWEYVYTDERMGWLSCYLVPVRDTAAQLNEPEYGRVPHRFEPGFDDSTDPIRYERYGNGDGYEPLIHHRSWHGLHPEQIEVIEEYRLFHNLVRATDGDLVRVSDDGAADETLVRLDDGKVDFLLGPLRQYLAAKQCTLVACIDWREHSEMALATLSLDKGYETFTGDGWIYSLGFGDGSTTFSRLLGKKTIEPPPVEHAGIWPYEQEETEEYPHFIIGLDDHGDAVSYSCQPGALGSYFDRDPDPNIPHYLTPVHFRRDVLERYFARPDRYRVEDGLLRCGNLWALQLDNDHPDHIVVYLGDLGRDLPNNERPHWVLHNIPPDGPLESETSIRRNRLAQFTDPTSPDLVMPRRLREVNNAWERRFGWPIFKPLSPEDEHDARRLRVPLSDSDTAFDEQIRILAKLTIESINNPELRHIAPPVPTGERRGSILTLHAALLELGLDEETVSERVTGLLGALNALNNGVRHGKGEAWRTAAETFGLPGRPRPDAFRDMLTRVLAALDVIELARKD